MTDGTGLPAKAGRHIVDDGRDAKVKARSHFSTGTNVPLSDHPLLRPGCLTT